MDGGMRMGEGMMPMGPMGPMGMGMPETTSPEAPQPGSGFTVVIEGYSPYQNIAELLDPPRVGEQQNRWGMVTRLGNLNKLFPNASFELFKKADVKHFRLETGLVDPQSKNMPVGIGIPRQVDRPSAVSQQAGARRDMGQPMTFGLDGEMGQARGPEYISSEMVLFDPMTDEEISRTYDIVTQEDILKNPAWKDSDLGRKKTTAFGQEQFISRDYWFRLQAKFAWKDAPADPLQSTQSDAMMMGW